LAKLEQPGFLNGMSFYPTEKERCHPVAEKVIVEEYVLGV
jgi:hypothetical protein